MHPRDEGAVPEESGEPRGVPESGEGHGSGPGDRGDYDPLDDLFDATGGREREGAFIPPEDDVFGETDSSTAGASSADVAADTGWQPVPGDEPEPSVEPGVEEVEEPLIVDPGPEPRREDRVPAAPPARGGGRLAAGIAALAVAGSG